MPLSIIGFKKAIKKLYGEDKNTPTPVVIEYYDHWLRDSKGREHPVPAVIANTHHVTRNYRKVPFSRQNIFKRDGYSCQYCGHHFKAAELTIDHVVPRRIWSGVDSPTSWHNVVASCHPCNHKKRDRTPEQAGMPLYKVVNGKKVFYKRPKRPNYVEVVLGSSRMTIDTIPVEWQPYIGYLLKG